MIQKGKKKKDDSLVSTLDFFLKQQLSQEEITQTAFTIQLQLSEFLSKSKKKSGAPRSNSDIKDEFADKCISIIMHYLEPNRNQRCHSRDQVDQISLVIMNFIPSLLQKIDNSDQIYLTNLLDQINPSKSIQIELQLALFHSISEIIQRPNLSSLFRQKITSFLEFDSNFSPAILNICIFNFETQKQYQKQWSALIRDAFLSSNKENLIDSVILLQSKRTCSNELCNSLCSLYQNIKIIPSLKSLDFLLILILTSINSNSTNKLFKYFVQSKRLNELTLKDCRLNIIPINNLIDTLYTISSSLKLQQIEELARIISEMFITSEKIEILTFALFNEDENKVFLDATISAISLSIVNSPQLFISKFDSIGVLSTVSKQVCQKLIYPILKLSLLYSQLFDSVIVFLRKMAARPTWTEFVINSLCFFLKSSAIHQKESRRKNQSLIDHQTEVIEIISKLITSPYVRSKIFYKLSSVCEICNANLKKQIQKLADDYKHLLSPENFVDLIDNEFEQIETDGCIAAIKDIPVSEIKLLLSLGTKPDDFFYLIELYKDGFNVSSHLALQLALRADAYSVLAPFHPDAFVAFSEYLIAIDYFSNPDERKVINEWCYLTLDHKFVRDSIINNLFTDPLLLYTLIRQISVFSSDVDIELIESCRLLFIRTASCKSDIDSDDKIELTQHQLLCDFIPPIVYQDIVDQFREELTVEIAKFIDVQCPTPLDYKIFVDEMKMIKFQKGISSRHFQAFLNIFKKSLQVSSESADLMFDILTSLKIDDSKVLSTIINLALTRSPPENAFFIAKTLIQNLLGEESNITMNRDPLKHAALWQILKFISSSDKVNQPILDLLYPILLLDVELPTSLVYNISLTINHVIKILTSQITSKQIEFNVDEFKNICETFLNKNKSKVGARQYGSTTAYLKMLSNSNKKFVNNISDDYEYESDNGIEDFTPAFDALFEKIQNKEIQSNDEPDMNIDELLLDQQTIQNAKSKKRKKKKKLPRFVQRKWRSKSKWIDDGLKDETGSDDNFADLEDFVVDESPPPDENEEEDESYF